jgi:hypothetical protein
VEKSRRCIDFNEWPHMIRGKLAKASESLYTLSMLTRILHSKVQGILVFFTGLEVTYTPDKLRL